MRKPSEKCQDKSPGWVFVTRMIGVISLLIIIVVAKILENFTTPGGMYQRVVEGLLIANFWLLLLIAIIILIADVFLALPFPFNLPGPVIRAIGSVFCIALIFYLFTWIDGTTGTDLSRIFLLLSFLIVPLVFIIVLISGYFRILRKLFLEPRESAGDGTVVMHPEYPKADGQEISDAKSWDEIGAEFRMVLYDLLHRFREEVKRK